MSGTNGMNGMGDMTKSMTKLAHMTYSLCLFLVADRWLLHS
jgi:hypothetical protein